MSESRWVPAFYPDYTDPKTLKRWDGSIEAEAWADLLEIRDATFAHAIVTAAVGLIAAGEDAGKRVDLEGLSVALWSVSPEQIAEIISTHRKEIERQVENL